jgi:mRNA interferase YafQ
MRTIKGTSQYKKDYKRERSGKLGKKLKGLLREPLELLSDDVLLPRRYEDHPMSGKWGACRNCHLRPDLVLTYRKPDDDTLELVRLGSHSELGL